MPAHLLRSISGQFHAKSNSFVFISTTTMKAGVAPARAHPYDYHVAHLDWPEMLRFISARERDIEEINAQFGTRT